MPVTLDQILSTTRGGLEALRRRRAALERAAAEAPPAPSFEGALRGPPRGGGGVGVIAELKRRSPSAGVIREALDPAERAALYAAHGAAAVSVLTDAPFFGGSLADLRAAAGAGVPLLRKDFILDEVQVFEARAAGAAAVLLIVRALEPARLRRLLAAAEDSGLDALVEVHTGAELARAAEAGARVIGVNSRDLDTFRVDTVAAWALLAKVPADLVAVAESGMASVDDVEGAAARGADAVLVGTALSSAADPAALLDDLTAVRRRGR